ncbi:MAG: cadmium-translocating P-type ATPase [Gemmatimonadetes bacterium]|uniref:P-type Zn(2+) transporter n=1 Tax=Candidatus Kutchimonas denitrificans TaxID=3056748 RepID=A0AAE4Z8U1_9BACT|nr:cadmium-translocating P-type ATPase [Gemmatimonadota bacterium]NIR74742.1 cadmium-translocating P-type ATPase [Candidatus Kutchimonas denitrificans]NIS01492.1 cadmium-translocating P-type ATPase [Gemmatimonadota bacterium]NIT67233.1 cadmium-translocating P-type ATPase [Gemmatimonadota bacterium]NIU52407.1 cadmium-translocating P-type ATPase [Gemmatimonadota bacterium]
MDCATCARRITDRLEHLDGIEGVETRIVSKDLRVNFDPDRTTKGTIEEAIRSLGYTVERDGQGAAPETRDRRARVWWSPEAWLSYASGAGLAVGLLLRIAGLSPRLAVLEPLSGVAWAVDLAALLFIAAALVGGLNFFPKGLRAARIVRLDMNFLMTVAIFGALGVGEFIEAGSIAFLFGIAELLERYAVDRARRSLEALLDLAPATARVYRDGRVVELPVTEVEPGDLARVLPGEKVPIDGWVRDGVSAVDQSPITGESMPATKSPGDYVYAGSMNRDGYLEVEAAKRAGDTTLAHIIHLVEEAESTRSPSERFVDRFARYYTPAVTLLAVAVITVPPLAFGGAFATWFVRGLTLLVISCPCALVISTPVAVVSGITSAARNGVLIKGGVHLEALADIEVVALDKTGTLTRGELAVAEVVATEASETDARELLSIAAAVESRSEHPIARAIGSQAAETDADVDFEITDFEAIPGQGAAARLNGTTYRIGRPEFFDDQLEPWRAELERLADRGQTPVCVGNDDRVLGLIAVADRERDEAARVIEELRALGVRRIVMLTGDHEATARTVARRLGVDEYYAGLLPDEKVARVRRLEEEYGGVAMVGDGVNDAPALAAARVGIAMGAAASDVALETADVALMADDLAFLPYLFRLSRRGSAVIRQNITVSIALKVSLAAGVFPGWVSLITAVLVGDMGASLAVTANALRLARLRR